jgi:hypothetical protein
MKKLFLLFALIVLPYQLTYALVDRQIITKTYATNCFIMGYCTFKIPESQTGVLDPQVFRISVDNEVTFRILDMSVNLDLARCGRAMKDKVWKYVVRTLYNNNGNITLRVVGKFKSSNAAFVDIGQVSVSDIIDYQQFGCR